MSDHAPELDEGLTGDDLRLFYEDDLRHDYLKRTAGERQANDERYGTPPLEKFAHVWEGR